MNPIKLIRSLGKVLRGGATFRDMFLGILLGFAVGMTPGLNLTVILFVALLLFLNTNGVLAAVSLVLGKVLCYALAPVTFQIGYALIHELGLMGPVQAAGDTPVVALLDLHVYCLIGALPVILVGGGLVAFIVPWLVTRARARMAAAADGKAAQKVAGSKFARVVLRVLFGKQKTSFAEMDKRKSPLIRKGRVLVAVVIVGALCAALYYNLDRLTRDGVKSGLELVNGAEVNIDAASLSLGGGKLELKGLQVTDAGRPTHNRVQAESITTTVDLMSLLTRRFVVDSIEGDAIRTDTKRKTPGAVYRVPRTPAETTKSAGDLLGGLVEEHAGKAAEYYAEIKKLNDKLSKVTEYLKSKESQKADPADLAARAKAEGYLALSARDYLAKHPTWVIRKVEIRDVELPVDVDLPTFIIKARDLSSHPSLHPRPPKLWAEPDPVALNKFVARKLAGAGGDPTKTAAGALGNLLDPKKDDKKKDDKKKGVLDLLGR